MKVEKCELKCNKTLDKIQYRKTTGLGTSIQPYFFDVFAKKKSCKRRQ